MVQDNLLLSTEPLVCCFYVGLSLSSNATYKFCSCRLFSCVGRQCAADEVLLDSEDCKVTPEEMLYVAAEFTCFL